MALALRDHNNFNEEVIYKITIFDIAFYCKAIIVFLVTSLRQEVI